MSLKNPVSDHLCAGVGRVDITPRIGCLMMGYADPERKAEGVRDPLHATAIWMESQGRRAVLISLDVIVVDRETTEFIRRGIQDRTGVDGSLVTIHPIQTHSGPCTQNIWGWSNRDDEYVFGIMAPAAIEAAEKARRAIVPVRVGFGVCNSDVGINRRSVDTDGSIVMAQYPIGLHDPNMTIIRFESAKSTIANVVHYGAHPTVFGQQSRVISRDWPGIMIDRLETFTNAPTLFCGGATGDVAPRTCSLGPTGDQAEAALWEAGSRAAIDALSAWRSIKDFRDIEMHTLTGQIDLPYQELPSRAEALKMVAECDEQKDTYGLGMAEYKHWSAVLAANDGPVQTAYRFPSVVTAIGPLAIVPAPGEIFAETSLRLRDKSPFQYTLPISLTGDCIGYFPTRESYVRGGYEPWVAKAFGPNLLAEGIDDVLVKENLRLLHELFTRMYPPLGPQI